MLSSIASIVYLYISLKYRGIAGVIIYSSFFDNAISTLSKSSINYLGVLYILHDIEEIEKFIFPNICFIVVNSDFIEDIIKSFGDFSALREVIFLSKSFMGNID